MLLTRHAQKRLQQRGIPEAVVDVLIDFGHSSKAGCGCEIVYLTHRDKCLAESSLSNKGHRNRIGNAYLVLGPDGQVITAGRRHHRIKTH